MPRLAASSILLALLTCGLAANLASAAPVVTQVIPATGPSKGGILITVVGSGFLDSGLPPTVRFGAREVVPTDVTPVTVVFELPRRMRPRPEILRVVAGGESSNEATFSYLPPTVTGMSAGVSPRSGGMLLTIRGENFTGSFPRVSFAGLGSVRPVHATDDTLVVNSPPAASAPSCEVRVVLDADSAVAGTLTYGGPRITSVSVPSVKLAGGETITIVGEGFSGNVRVRINELEARLKSLGLLSAVVVTPPLPPGTTDVDIEVCADGGCSNAARVAGDQTPIIRGSALGEARASGGSVITIVGSGLADVKQVRVGFDTPAPMQVDWDRVVFEAPPSPPGPVDVAVSVDGSTWIPAGTLKMRIPPSIQGVVIDKRMRSGGGVITIHGQNFGDSQGGVARHVTVQGRDVGPVRWMSPEVLEVTAPAGDLGPADVTVDIDGESATQPAAFAYDDGPPATVPQITLVTPSSARAIGGSLITLTGSGFASPPSSNTVRLRSHPPLTPVSGSPVHLVFTLPPGVPGEDLWVVVERDSVCSPPAQFLYSPPEIDAISPPGGSYAGGGLITIVGRDFVDPEVLIDGVSHPPLYATNDTVIVNAAAGGASASVRTYGTRVGLQLNSAQQWSASSNVMPYTHAGPLVTGVEPLSALATGGSVITLSGSGFSAVATGDSSSTRSLPGRWKAPELSRTANAVVAKIPHRPFGSGGGGGGGGAGGMLRVSADGVESNSIPFDWIGPAVSEVSPQAGRAGGGSILTIRGQNFTDRTTVSIGGVAATLTDFDVDFITCVSPPGAAGARELVVDDEGLVAMSTFGYLAPPAVSDVSPPRGAVAGGVPITIFGSDFGFAGDGVARAVTLGGQAVAELTLTAEGALSFVAPPAAAPGPAALVVTVDGVSTTVPNAFWYTDALGAEGAPPPSRLTLTLAGANPSRDATRLRLALPRGGAWSLELLDVAGQRVRRLAGHAPAGWLDVAWDGLTDGGRRAAPGLYFARAASGDERATQRVVRMW